MSQQVVPGAAVDLAAANKTTTTNQKLSEVQQQETLSNQARQQETNNNLESRASNDSTNILTKGKLTQDCLAQNAINHNNNNNNNNINNNSDNLTRQRDDSGDRKSAEEVNFVSQTRTIASSKSLACPQGSADAAQDKLLSEKQKLSATTTSQDDERSASTASTLHTVIDCSTEQADKHKQTPHKDTSDSKQGSAALTTDAARDQLLLKKESLTLSTAAESAQPKLETEETPISQESSGKQQTTDQTVNIEESKSGQIEEQEKARKINNNNNKKTLEEAKTHTPINHHNPHPTNNTHHEALKTEGKKCQDHFKKQPNKKNANQKSGLINITNNNHNSLSSSSSGSLDSSSFSKTKCRRLSYFQSLLLRKWPWLAFTICIMSSLLFGILLSALTVYWIHGVTDCSNLALAREPVITSARHQLNSPPHELLRAHRPSSVEFDTPLELYGGGGNGGPLDGRVLTSPTSSAADQSMGPAHQVHFQRLPGTILPIHYDLFVQPYIAEPFNFSGRVSIRIKCMEPTDNITLHALDLSLNEKSLSLTLAPSETVGNTSQAATSPSLPKVIGLSEDKQLQYSIIKLDTKLEPQLEYILGIDFVGSLNDDLAGFYKIKYERQNSSGEITWIAATQFQATDARRAFPCFDEPLYKATFSIQIKHWKNMTALSNMPIIESKDSTDGLWVTDTFAKSHRMSTYLVAYAVTNFESRSEGNISVWTRPGFGHSAEYALKIAGKILRYYEDFFGIEYPLPKMDMIALPDFNAGAMENWGLITYRETAMLYDPNSSSIANKHRVAVVVAHELAHQWFGNLVTPKWWDDLWLNEGFASYVEYIGVDHVEPEWRMLDQFVIEEVQNVFKTDALSSSHQISIPVNNPEEISEIFDQISYSKSASIIRMMSNFLTEDVFKLGLRRYLRTLRYSNAVQSDLWAHLTEAQKLVQAARFNTTTTTNSDISSSSSAGFKEPQQLVNVERVMNSWTLQTGYPLVTLKRQYNNNKNRESTALLEQERYQPYKLQLAANKTTAQQKESTSSSSSASSAGAAQKWEIPITMTWRTENNFEPRTRFWLHQNDSRSVELKGNNLVAQSDDDWMLLNINQVGYYRVNYDQRNWQLLIDQLNEDHKKIGTTNRAQLLDDIFELARSGVMNYKFAMESTKYLKNERDYLPWDAVLMSFSYIDDMLQRTPLYGEWRDYIADLIEPYYARYKHIDWLISPPSSSEQKQQTSSTINRLLLNSSSSSSNNNTSSSSAVVSSTLPDNIGQSNNTFKIDSNDVLDQYNHVNAVSWACQVNDHCVNRAKATFKELRATGINRINPALRFTVYCSAIEHGTKDDWEFLWKTYENEQNASERDRIMKALACTKEIWMLSRYLDWTFDKTKPIRRQDGAFVFKMIAKNNYGRDVAFNFMRERWSTIKEFYGKASFSLGNLIRSIGTSMNTQIELNEFTNFYESIKNDVGTGKRSFQIAIEEVESNVMWRNRNYKLIADWIHEERMKATTTNVNGSQ